MDQNKRELMHEVLTNRYYLGYLAHPNKRAVAVQLHKLGYFNDETGQATETAQEYFDEMFEEIKPELKKEVRLLNKEPKTYDEFSVLLGFPKGSFYLHHFLMKFQRKNMISYRETDEFDSELKIKIIDLDKE